MRKTKEQKAITLIALIITIVLLLILAIVAVGAVRDGNIIVKAKYATAIQQVAQANEALKLKLNEEVYVTATQKSTEYAFGGKVWKEAPFTSYTNTLLRSRYGSTYFVSISGGIVTTKMNSKNIYKTSGELIAENIFWIPTDFLTLWTDFSDEMIEEIENEGYTLKEASASITNDLFGSISISDDDFEFDFESCDLDLDIGYNGSLLRALLENDFVEDSGLEDAQKLNATEDIFVLDKNNEIWYIDKDGNLIGKNEIYLKDEIKLESANIANLSELEKEKYDRLYEATYSAVYANAQMFTNSTDEATNKAYAEEYAKYIADNDYDYNSLTNNFFSGGYFLMNAEKNNTTITYNNKELKDLAILMVGPDWVEQDMMLSNDATMYLLDSDYKMYLRTSNKELYDLNKKDESGNPILIETNVRIESVSSDDQVVQTRTIEENGVKYIYGYLERFDKKDVLIMSIPEKETVDIKTDLADLEINCWYAISNDVVTHIILPDSIKTLDMLAATRRPGYPMGDFLNCPNLETIELSNNIETIWACAFEELPNLKTVIMPDRLQTIVGDIFDYNTGKNTGGVTLKFKDGKAPSGYPWGGTNITVTSK